MPVNCGNKKAELPGEFSFISLSQPHALLSTVKKCEGDNDVVIRVFDIRGEDSDVEINTFFPISNAEHTNIIEEEGKAIPASGEVLRTKLGHHAIETYKIQVK